MSVQLTWTPYGMRMLQSVDHDANKGHLNISGLDITIENPIGSQRREAWPTMQSHYGEIKGTLGADGDCVDCFIRQGTSDNWNGTVFVINQKKKQGTGVFDEHKVMIGYDTQEEAMHAHRDSYEAGWWSGESDIKPMSMDEFKGWLKNGNLRRPI